MSTIFYAITPNPSDLPVEYQPTDFSSNSQPTKNTPGSHCDLHPINSAYQLYGNNYLQWS